MFIMIKLAAFVTVPSRLIFVNELLFWASNLSLKTKTLCAFNWEGLNCCILHIWMYVNVGGFFISQKHCIQSRLSNCTNWQNHFILQSKQSVLPCSAFHPSPWCTHQIPHQSWRRRRNFWRCWEFWSHKCRQLAQSPFGILASEQIS